jgi:hypothetical protein
MVEFHEAVLKLQEGPTWKCKPGYKIFVLDQGLLRFDIPEDWVVEPGDTSVKFYDRKPPDDNCRLEVSLLHHPQIDWSLLPLDQLLRHLGHRRSGEEIRNQGMYRQNRPGLDLVWVEETFIDPNESKPARSRIAIVRGTNGHALVTLDFWEEDAGRLLPTWDEVMRSIDMGLKVRDPAMGEQQM